MANVIDYARLAKAISYFTNIGYNYVEVPWAMPRWAVEVTAPDIYAMQATDHEEFMVGSAEQSFIGLDAMDKLGTGRFVACTPCFRPADNDAWHQPYFMKVELYRNDYIDHHVVNEMIMEAMEFYRQQLANVEYALTRKDFNKHEADILLNGIEVGSYGLRECGSLQWAYGTGLAEPRFSMAAAQSPEGVEEWKVFKQEVEA